VVLLQINFGSGSYLLKVSDTTGSGSTTLKKSKRNTGQVGFPSADSHTEPNYDKLGLFRRLALHAVLYLFTEGCLVSAATIMTKKIRRFL
jgi:hypothetical protein